MKNKIMNLAQNIKKFFTTHTKMKLLVAYLVANLLYITIGSYIFMTKHIVPNFNYQQFSLGLRNILILNVIVFLVICFEKCYKKNLAHIGIATIGVIRLYCDITCIR